MELDHVLARLSGDLAWGVVFRASALRASLPDDVSRAMFFLPPDTPFGEVRFVVLTAAGPCLVFEGRDGLVAVRGEVPEPRGGRSAAEAHASLLGRVPVAEADCLGFGHIPGRAPVLLFARIHDGVAEARAFFESEPSRRHYELLPAVGVEWLGGAWVGDVYEARYRNRLRAHVGAGVLAGFSRTGYCNLFFLRHGEVDEELVKGLRRAASDRLEAARSAAAIILGKLARTALRRPLAMLCVPPPPDRPFAYGDLVPLGFVLRALEQAGEPGVLDAVERLRAHLESVRERGLWAFHTGHLATATDSVLVMLGSLDAAGVEALELLRVDEGGYVPQLWGATRGFARMAESPATVHWCQPDFPTTCLARAHRAALGLQPVTATGWIAARFDERSGLFFANPYLVDWAAALALRRDDSAEAAALRARLRDEVLASRNDDGTFGRYDVPFSTALAILTLDALGHRGGEIWLAKLRLLESQDGMGLWPASTPFYSTFRIEADGGDRHPDHAPTPPDNTVHAPAGDAGAGIVEVAGETHALSLYVDRYRMIGTSLALLALGVDAGPGPVAAAEATPHPRYRCASVADYVRRFALPPYLSTTRGYRRCPQGHPESGGVEEDAG